MGVLVAEIRAMHKHVSVDVVSFITEKPIPGLFVGERHIMQYR